MTPDDFKAWRKSMGMTQTEAGDALGVSKGTIINYEAGKRRDDGRTVEIPKTVALACTAVAKGLGPWPNEKPAS